MKGRYLPWELSHSRPQLSLTAAHIAASSWITSIHLSMKCSRKQAGHSNFHNWPHEPSGCEGWT
jgi:hypothetical protein